MIDEINELGKCIGLRKAAYDRIWQLQSSVHLQNVELVQESIAKISEAWKTSYVQVLKLGRLIEKRFKSHACTGKDRIMNKHELDVALAHHFYRLGRLDLVETFTAEAQIALDQTIRCRFVDLFSILEALGNFDLGPAMKWALRNRDYLDQKSSNLEFQLATLLYVSLLLNNQYLEALEFSQLHFSRFAHLNQQLIQKLVGCLVYAKRLDTSPYLAFLKNGLGWDQVKSTFIKEYSAWMGLPYESPIESCLEIGHEAFPKLVKVSLLMHDRGIEWTLQNELPIEIPISNRFKYHSTFSCPIMKEPSSRENPPMVLPCGHVLSKVAITKLSKSSNHVKFKCPYCPGESTASQSMVVYIE